MKMENHNPLLTAHYVERADQFLQGMRLLADDLNSYGSGVGLLAVHSAISLNDAILVAVTGKHSKGDNHQTAVHGLETACHEGRVRDKNGINHFKWLISKKSNIAYGGDRVGDKELKQSITAAQRFAAWAYTHFKEVLRVEEA